METIVVGTDFSAPANNAVNYAVHLARYFNAKLILVNSFSLPVAGYDSLAPLTMISDIQDISLKSLRELKEKIIKENYDFGIECVSQVGTPYGVIKDVSDKYSADLIVMGMVGEGSFVKRHIVGSSATDVARNLTRPVFIVPEGIIYDRIREISFACDMDNIQGTTVIHAARYFAAAFNAELELVSVETNDQKAKAHSSAAYTFVEKRLEGVKHKHVSISDDDVSKALEYYFKFHKTDLVMIHPKKHTFFEKIFSPSISKDLSFAVKVPMLMIH